MGSDHILQLGVARHLVDLVKDLIYNASVRIYRRAEDHCDQHSYLLLFLSQCGAHMTSSNVIHILVLAGWDILLSMLIFVVVVVVVAAVILSMWNSNIGHIWYIGKIRNWKGMWNFWKWNSNELKEIKESNHQTTNLVFLDFFLEFFSVW